MKTQIIGKTISTIEQAKLWAQNHKATNEFVALTDLYWPIALKLNIRADVAFAQAAKETGFGRFGGVIDSTFHNPCGLKTRAGGGNSERDAHQRFSDWATGVLAHIQHLVLYTGGTITEPIVDPRHFSYLKGKASTVEQLGGVWAPNPQYGTSIVNDYLAPMIATVVPTKPKSTPSEWAKEAWTRAVSKGALSDENPQGVVTREMLAKVLDNLGLL